MKSLILALILMAPFPAHAHESCRNYRFYQEHMSENRPSVAPETVRAGIALNLRAALKEVRDVCLPEDQSYQRALDEITDGIINSAYMGTENEQANMRRKLKGDYDRTFAEYMKFTAPASRRQALKKDLSLFGEFVAGAKDIQMSCTADHLTMSGANPRDVVRCEAKRVHKLNDEETRHEQQVFIFNNNPADPEALSIEEKSYTKNVNGCGCSE